MGRSKSGGRRLAPAPSLAAAPLPRVWQGIGYRALSDAASARPLFDFAAVPWPVADPATLVLAWGAWTGPTGAADGSREAEQLVGAIVGEASDGDLMLYGPVVLAEQEPLEVAAQLVAAALDHAGALGARTVFARPLGLDRVWVRFGFIPVPESTLPPGLAGRPGGGLYAWRGGSALWTLREQSA